MLGGTQTARAARDKKNSLAAFLSDGQPFTIRRLRELGPGERLVYYRGHFTFDLDRSERGSPYRELLVRVRETAIQLFQQGKVLLSEVPHRDEKGAIHYEYIATGRQ